MSARLTTLRLTQFKTFQNAALPLSDMTVLIGRNSSGKSNALDGLEVLSRLAEGATSSTRSTAGVETKDLSGGASQDVLRMAPTPSSLAAP